jgi:polysaccharide chain length determinant protein (PEP-CTERM system associated)
LIPGKQYTPEIILGIAWRYKWVILIPAILIAGGVAMWTRTLIDMYSSEVLILVVPQQVARDYVKSTVTASAAERMQTISQQILSRSRLEKIVTDLNLYLYERQHGAIMEDLVDSMRAGIVVQGVRADSFRVGFMSPDPRIAMQVADKLGSAFIDESLRDREVLSEGTSQFLEAQLEDARRQLIDNEKRLETYRRNHNGELPQQVTANMQGMQNAAMQLQALDDSINRDTERQAVLKDTIADLEVSQYSQAPAPPPAQHAETAADRLHAAEAALRAMEMRLKPTHPDVIRARKGLDALRKAADDEAAAQPIFVEETISPAERLRLTRLADANRELVALQQGVQYKAAEQKRLRAVQADYQARLEATPARENELVDLMRDYGTLQGLYQSLLSKRQESQISANLERRQIGEQFRILDPARMPGRPFTPNRPRYYGMGVLGGLAVGLVLAGLLEYLDRTMRSEDDVRAALNLPVVAAIPFIHERISLGRRVLVTVSAATAAAIVIGGAVFALRHLR